MGSMFPQDYFSVIAHRGSTTKFPENTIPAFQEALNIDGANALQTDLSLTRDRKIVLWNDWNINSTTAMIRHKKGLEAGKFRPYGPSLEGLRWGKKISELDFAEFTNQYGYKDKITNTKANAKIPTLHDLIEWATKQDKLKLLLLKLRVPADEIHLASVMLEEIRRTIDSIYPPLRFQFLILIPHKEVLKLARNQFDKFLFSFDFELFPAEIINYHRFTTIPIAMRFKNRFSSIGFPIYSNPMDNSTQDPWLIYKYILTLDFKIRDNYYKSTSNYIKIFSWTFNEKKKIKCLINLGVDGIITDKPKMLRKIALEMGKNLD